MLDRSASDHLPILTAGLAGQAFAVAEAALGERLRGRERRGVLVAVDDPVLAAVTLFRLPKRFVTAPVRWSVLTPEAARLLDRLRPALLVTDRPESALAQAAAARGLEICVLSHGFEGVAAEFRASSGGLAAPLEYPSDTAIVLQTSGTTGEPKIVALSRSNVAASVENIVGSLGLGPGDRTLAMMPLTHIHGVVAALHATLESGGELLATLQLDAGAFWATAPQFRPTWLTLAPTLLGALCDAAPEGRDIGGALRFARSASAALPNALRERAELILGAPVLEAYGMTEACHQVSSNTLAARRAGSVGLAGPAPEVSIRDAGDVEVARGATGEVCVRGANLFGGYLGDPAGPRDADAWFRTGDLGRIDDDGYLFLSGRIKEQINRGGETLSPVEIENALVALDGVASAAVFPLPHPTLGEEVAAVVKATRPDMDERHVIALAADVLSFEALPKRIFVVDEIPTSPASGKVSRRALAEHYAAEVAHVETGRAPDEIEDQVAAIFAKTLMVEELDRDASFFALGGTSLQAARIVCAIRLTLGADMPISAIVLHPTARAMAQAVAAAGESASTSAPAEPGPPVLPRSLVDFCVAQAIDPLRDDVRQGFVVTFPGAVSPADIEAGLSAMSARHAALRSFVGDPGGDAPVFVVGAAATPVVTIIAEPPTRNWRESASLRRFFAEPVPLDAAPLVRVAALKRGRGWFFAFSAAEIALDGYARMRFIAELAERLAGREPHAREDRFGELLARRRRETAAPSAVEAVQPPPDLYGAVAPHAAHVSRTLDRVTWDAVENLARRIGATPFAVALAALSLALERISAGPVEIIVSVQRRRSADEFHTIGNFVDRISTISELADGEEGFDAFARRVSAALLTAAETAPHRSIAFGERVVMFEVEDELQTLVRHGDADITSLLSTLVVDHAPPGSLTASLAFTISPAGQYGRPGRGKATLAYDASLFSAGRAGAMLDAVLAVIERATAAPAIGCRAVSLIRPRQQVLSAAAAHVTGEGLGPLAGTERLNELFEALARQRPGAVALRYPGGAATFAELEETATRAAERIAPLIDVAGRPAIFWDAPRLGADAADLAAGWSPLYAIASLAVLKSGGVVTPVGKAVPPAQFAVIAENAGACLVATAAEALPKALAGRYAPCGQVETMMGPLRLFGRIRPSRVRPGPPEAAYLMHSSGTTGTPKGILQSHRGLIELAHAALFSVDWPQGDVMPGHDVGFDVFVGALWIGWSAGFAAHAPRQFDYSPQALRELRAAGVRTFMTSPTVVAALIAEDETCLSGFALVGLNGEETPRALAERLLSLEDRPRFADLYGPTETTVWATFEEFVAPMGPRVPIGNALPGYRIEIGEFGSAHALPHDLPGEILISPPSQPFGYFNDRAANGRAFIRRSRDGANRIFYRSGDVGWIDGDGKVHYAGRRDRQVQLSGVRVELGGVEAVIARVDGVAQAAVVDVPTPSGPYLAAFILPDGGADPAAVSAKAAAAARRALPAAAAPHVVVPLETLPKSRSGKTDFITLRSMAASARADRHKERPRSNSIEAYVAEVWSELLGERDFALADDFLQSGGTSLGVLRLSHRLKRRFGVEVAVAELFFATTIAAQAALVRGRGGGATVAAPVRSVAAEREPILRMARIDSPSALAKTRPAIVGLPSYRGESGGVGNFSLAFARDYDFAFIETTAFGRDFFDRRASMPIAREAVRLIQTIAEEGRELVFVGFSYGGWMAWLTERVLAATSSAVGARVISIDGGPLHLSRAHYASKELTDAVAAADRVAPTDMLLIARELGADRPFAVEDRWSQVNVAITRAPEARTMIHRELTSPAAVEAYEPYVREWLERRVADDWPDFLTLGEITAGQMLREAIHAEGEAQRALYQDVRSLFVERRKFIQEDPIFECLALKLGDVDAAAVIAERHYRRYPERWSAAIKWIVTLDLLERSAEADNVAERWLALNPDKSDQLALRAELRALKPQRKPPGEMRAGVAWWRYLFVEARTRRLPLLGWRIGVKR